MQPLVTVVKLAPLTPTLARGLDPSTSPSLGLWLKLKGWRYDSNTDDYLLLKTDSTIGALPASLFLTNVSWLLDRHEDGCYKSKYIFVVYFLVCKGKGYRTMTSGWHGASYFGRYGRELVSKPEISLKKSPGTIPQSDCKVNANADGNDISPNR